MFRPTRSLALLLAALVATPANAEPVTPAAQAFEQLKALAGVWQNAEAPNGALRVHFTVTAAGSTVIEEWRAGEAPHSATIYHLDGDHLLATHYCPQGNQPRLASSAEEPLTFNFQDVTDLEPGEAHASHLALALEADRLVRRERYTLDGEAQEWSELVLQRVVE